MFLLLNILPSQDGHASAKHHDIIHNARVKHSVEEEEEPTMEKREYPTEKLAFKHKLEENLTAYFNREDTLCDPSTKTLVTLFTTLHDIPSRLHIHNNTLHNWVSLGRGVRALVYFNTTQESSVLIDLAKRLGWCVEAVPLYKSRLPVVRSMFMDVTSKYNSLFYGYVNSDILFDHTLVYTLKGLAEQQYQDLFKTNGALLIGKRTNVDLSVIGKRFLPSDVLEAKRKGKVFLSVAQDYFITTATGFPWQRIPDLVVGRPGYDNYFVIKALEWKLNILDTTDTLNAIHQTGYDGNQASFHRNNKCLNKNLVYPFDYTRGSTLCAPFFTAYNIHDNIVVVKRVWWPDKCTPPAVPKVWECTEAPPKEH